VQPLLSLLQWLPLLLVVTVMVVMVLVVWMLVIGTTSWYYK
jgi:hypothetical protein